MKLSLVTIGIYYESWNNSASYTFAKNLQKDENLANSPWCLLWMAHNYPSIFQLDNKTGFKGKQIVRKKGGKR